MILAPPLKRNAGFTKPTKGGSVWVAVCREGLDNPGSMPPKAHHLERGTDYIQIS